MVTVNMLQTLRNATKHNVYAQVHSIPINGLDETSHVVHITPWWKTALKAATIGFGTITILFIVLYYLEMLVWSKKERRKCIMNIKDKILGKKESAAFLMH